MVFKKKQTTCVVKAIMFKQKETTYEAKETSFIEESSILWSKRCFF
jgi:hypothetical protein